MSCAFLRNCSILSALAFALVTHQALATMAVSSSFHNMIAESTLIVRAEIVQGGQMHGRARMLETFKGEPPTGDFVVTGFNNGCWPKPDLLRESVKTKEQYLFFLRPIQQDAPVDTGSVPSSTCGEGPDVPKEWRALPRYEVPTPSMGDYRVDSRGVHCDWSFCSDCSDTLTVPNHIAWTQLRALAHPKDQDAILAARSDLARELTSELVGKAASNQSARVTLAWLLEGQSMFGERTLREAVIAGASSPQPEIRVASVRALPSLGATDEVMQLIDQLLQIRDVTEAGALQVEATRALVRLDPDGRRGVDMILAAIPMSDASEAVQRDVMDPALGRWASAREIMVRALTRYRVARAESAFIALLRRSDSSSGVLDALMTHFSSFPSVQARVELMHRYRSTANGELDRFHRFFIDDGDSATEDQMFSRMLAPTSEEHDLQRMLNYYALHRPAGDSRLEAAALMLLRNRADDGTLAPLVPMAMLLLNQGAIRRLLHVDPAALPNGDSKTLERVARAILLKRSPAPHAEARMRAWLQLLMDDRWSGYATPYLLRECVCSTPTELHPTLLRWFEKEKLSQLAERATAALRFDKQRVAEGETPEFFCFPESSKPATVLPRLTQNQARAPARGGCSAGCATSSRGDASGPLVAIAMALLTRRRMRQAVRA